MGEKKKTLKKAKMSMKSLELLTLINLGESHLSKPEKCAFGKAAFCTGTIEKHSLAFPNAFDDDREVL